MNAADGPASREARRRRDREISRRRLFGFIGGYVGATALGIALAPKVRAKEPSSGAIGMLYDTTKCIGCKSCVYECRKVNGLEADTAISDGLWQMPMDLNSQTKNLIKLYESDDGSQWSFFKHQCMHCVDPSCVDGCPFGALQKDEERGIVTWTGSRCIGCRYCEVSCPYRVPKFEWHKSNPKIVKCEFCRHVLGKPESEGGISEPGCTEVCPTGAVIFGTREGLLAEAKQRLQDTPGKYHEDRVFGEDDGGGTQVFYLSHVPFTDLGLPTLRKESIGKRSKKVHRFFTQWLVFPIALYAVFVALIQRNWKDHERDVQRMEATSGLKEQVLSKGQTAKGARRPLEREYYTPEKAVVNVWQRGVPVYGQKIVTPGFIFLMVLAAIGITIAVVRIVQGRLGAYTGLNDAYPWGIWKTFNVMALTALGSGAMSVGIAAWVLYRKRLHTLMRTAVVTSFLFYSVGLVALLIDAGRPWNFVQVFMPWTWNMHSPLWEVALAMPAYTVIFLSFEMAPIIMERVWYTGSPKQEGWVERWMPTIRKIYPFMVAGAYVMPMMHQSSLGALMLLGGPKLHALWNTPALPGFYLVQAGICGMGFVVVAVMGASLIWRRPLDMRVLGELAHLMAWVILLWVVARFVDVAIRGELAAAFALDSWSLLFLAENTLILAPGILLLSPRLRTIPKVLFWLAVLTCLGGLAYRFIPTTIAFSPGVGFKYFPSVPEILITTGLIALAIALFSAMVKMFAILPGAVSSWHAMFDYVTRKFPDFPRDAYGQPIAQD